MHWQLHSEGKKEGKSRQVLAGLARSCLGRLRIVPTANRQPPLSVRRRLQPRQTTAPSLVVCSARLLSLFLPHPSIACNVGEVFPGVGAHRRRRSQCHFQDRHGTQPFALYPPPQLPPSSSRPRCEHCHHPRPLDAPQSIRRRPCRRLLPNPRQTLSLPLSPFWPPPPLNHVTCILRGRRGRRKERERE